MTLFHVSSKKAVCQNFYMMYNFELSTCIIFRLEIMKTVSVLRKGMESVHYFMYGWKKKNILLEDTNTFWFTFAKLEH